jgi:hypothetical protein
MSDAFNQYLLSVSHLPLCELSLICFLISSGDASLPQDTSIHPSLTWNEYDPIYGMNTLHAQTSLLMQMQMFPIASSNVLGLDYAT